VLWKSLRTLLHPATIPLAARTDSLLPAARASKRYSTFDDEKPPNNLTISHVPELKERISARLEAIGGSMIARVEEVEGDLTDLPLVVGAREILGVACAPNYS